MSKLSGTVNKHYKKKLINLLAIAESPLPGIDISKRITHLDAGIVNEINHAFESGCKLVYHSPFVNATILINGFIFINYIYSYIIGKIDCN